MSKKKKKTGDKKTKISGQDITIYNLGAFFHNPKGGSGTGAHNKRTTKRRRSQDRKEEKSQEE